MRHRRLSGRGHRRDERETAAAKEAAGIGLPLSTLEAEEVRRYGNEAAGLYRAAVTDMRLILPLIPTRLIPGENTPSGEKVMAPAELIGEFFDDTYQRNRNAVNLRKLEPNEFSIDPNRGHIRTSIPLYRIQNGSSHLPARLWLRCGYHLRENLYGAHWTNYYEQNTGASNGTATEWINRSDISRKIIAVYPTDYAEPFTPGTPIDNNSAVQTILQNATTERIYQYSNALTPTVYRYTTIVSVPTNGRTSQVTHECAAAGRLRQLRVSALNMTARNRWRGRRSNCRPIRTKRPSLLETSLRSSNCRRA